MGDGGSQEAVNISASAVGGFRLRDSMIKLGSVIEVFDGTIF